MISPTVQERELLWQCCPPHPSQLSGWSSGTRTYLDRRSSLHHWYPIIFTFKWVLITDINAPFFPPHLLVHSSLYPIPPHTWERHYLVALSFHPKTASLSATTRREWTEGFPLEYSSVNIDFMGLIGVVIFICQIFGIRGGHPRPLHWQGAEVTAWPEDVRQTGQERSTQWWQPQGKHMPFRIHHSHYSWISVPVEGTSGISHIPYEGSYCPP